MNPIENSIFASLREVFCEAFSRAKVDRLDWDDPRSDPIGDIRLQLAAMTPEPYWMRELSKATPFDLDDVRRISCHSVPNVCLLQEGTLFAIEAGVMMGGGEAVESAARNFILATRSGVSLRLS